MMQIHHRNAKTVWEHGPHLAEFWYYPGVSGCDPSDYASTFFSKLQVQDVFDAVATIIDC